MMMIKLINETLCRVICNPYAVETETKQVYTIMPRLNQTKVRNRKLQTRWIRAKRFNSLQENIRRDLRKIHYSKINKIHKPENSIFLYKIDD